MRQRSAIRVLALSYWCGAVPFSNIAARVVAGVDLRQHGTGTVSGTGLYEVAGFLPLALAGSLDVAKGAIGPLLAGSDRPLLGALGAGASVAGHDWSPILGGKGGRGLSVALGATLVSAPEGAVVLGLGMAGGRLAHQTALGSLLATAVLFPLLGQRRGPRGVWLATCLAVPMVCKRLMGNESVQSMPTTADRSAGAIGRILLARLLFDRDTLRRGGDG
jgi:acyl phosphate:glycerol-3-phosphate acyltransferase